MQKTQLFLPDILVSPDASRENYLHEGFSFP